MAIEDCAREAVKHWEDHGQATIMVAIAGAESDWTDEPGDALSIYSGPERKAQEPYAHDGFTSWGAWQVNYRWNAGAIQALSGLTDPAEVSAWLLDTTNNASAAYDVWRRQGFRAWSTYNLGRHLRYMDAAAAAVDTALAEPPNPVPIDGPAQSQDEISIEQPGPIDPNLVSLLGYLQGDVAKAIRAPLEQLHDRSFDPGNLELVDAALAAVNTLESAGKE